MKLDFATLAFGHRITNVGGTPNWATSLGQGREYKINSSDSINEILKGMIHTSVPLNKIEAIIGRGRQRTVAGGDDSPLILASVFSKVYINETLVPDAKFVLLLTRDTSASHAGRLRLKYGPSNTFNDGTEVFSNEDFFAKVRQVLGLADDACWFTYSIRVEDQDKLFLDSVIVNADGPMEYIDTNDLHAAWNPLIPDAEFRTQLKGENVLLYGVPGAGKSHYIATNYPADDEHKQRVVFHPDYTYSDFVGQILPETREGENGEHIISYSFHPGPFTEILAKAAAHEDEQFYLVIEEINRGNAPAIFGDIFQLLDRDENGESQYGIKNADIADKVYGDPEHSVKIPANLTILATMNTADQNVFTLDTAFKRRWKMKSIKNDFETCALSPLAIGTTGITWKTFATEINKIIVQDSLSNASSEDKRLGAYFVTEEDLANNRTFAEKVLAYLWDDVFKYDKSKVFDSQLSTLEDAIDEFTDNGTTVFSSELRQTLSTVAADE